MKFIKTIEIYNPDKKRMIYIGVVVFVIAYCFSLDIIKISGELLTVVSILLAFNTTAIATLWDKPILRSMHNTSDSIVTYRSQLGVLLSYFKLTFITQILLLILILTYMWFYDINMVYINAIKPILSYSLIAILICNFYNIYIVFKIFIQALQNNISIEKAK